MVDKINLHPSTCKWAEFALHEFITPVHRLIMDLTLLLKFQCIGYIQGYFFTRCKLVPDKNDFIYTNFGEYPEIAVGAKYICQNSNWDHQNILHRFWLVLYFRSTLPKMGTYLFWPYISTMSFTQSVYFKCKSKCVLGRRFIYWFYVNHQSHVTGAV